MPLCWLQQGLVVWGFRNGSMNIWIRKRLFRRRDRQFWRYRAGRAKIIPGWTVWTAGKHGRRRRRNGDLSDIWTGAVPPPLPPMPGRRQTELFGFWVFIIRKKQAGMWLERRQGLPGRVKIWGFGWPENLRKPWRTGAGIIGRRGSTGRPGLPERSGWWEPAPPTPGSLP